MAKKSLSGHDFRAPVLLDGEVGSPGQVLTSQGSGTVPVWTSPTSGGLTASQYVSQGRLTADATVASNSDLVIPFIDDFDPQNWWNGSTRRFTPNIAGYYNVTLQVWWTSGSVTNNQNNIQIRKNGPNTIAISQDQIVTGSGYSQNLTKLIYLNGTTDYLDFTAYTANSSSQNLQWGGSNNGSGTYFSAALMTSGVGPTGPAGADGPAGAAGAIGPAGKFTTSDTAPSNPSQGDAWFDSLTAKLFVYYDSYWIEVGPNLSGPQGPAGVAGTNGLDGSSALSEFLMMGA